jgi:catechol 2,3-dioxygenase-like lactoylglutathione lyase family enzyme
MNAPTEGAGVRSDRLGRNISILTWLALLMNAPQGLRADENRYGLKAHHVTALVTDIQRATAWYKDMLGFKVIRQGSRLEGAMKYADLRIPGFGISLVQIQQPALEPAAGQLVRPAWVHIVFSVADPDKTFRHLKERGARVSTRESAASGPVKTFLLYDSEGNEIEIVADTDD